MPGFELAVMDYGLDIFLIDFESAFHQLMEQLSPMCDLIMWDITIWTPSLISIISVFLPPWGTFPPFICGVVELVLSITSL